MGKLEASPSALHGIRARCEGNASSMSTTHQGNAEEFMSALTVRANPIHLLTTSASFTGSAQKMRNEILVGVLHVLCLLKDQMIRTQSGQPHFRLGWLSNIINKHNWYSKAELYSKNLFKYTFSHKQD